MGFGRALLSLDSVAGAHGKSKVLGVVVIFNSAWCTYGRKRGRGAMPLYHPEIRRSSSRWFFQQLGLSGKGSRPEHWKALMIAFQGSVNAVPTHPGEPDYQVKDLGRL
jgi:hypothetical protein